ncbi:MULTISPECIES: hypothetical protein [Halomonadaceae]|nr:MULTISPECIES: hypothetical protein [Halomonas]
MPPNNASLGMAVYPPHGQQWETVLHLADLRSTMPSGCRNRR